MAVVLKKPKLVFIEEPRTASRSTQRWLKHLGGVTLGDDEFKHASVAEVRRRYPEYADFTFFACTRNPYDVVVTYYVQTRQALHKPGSVTPACIEASKRDLATFLSFQPAVERFELNDSFHFKRVEGVTHFYRYEDGVPGALVLLLRSLGVSVSDQVVQYFPFIGKMKSKQDYRGYHTERSKQLVARLFPRYIYEFCYTFEGVEG